MTEILAGSEGTLAAIFSAELKISPLPREKSLGVIFFASIPEAMQATVELLDLKPSAIEHVDRPLLDQTKGQLLFQPARDFGDRGDGRVHPVPRSDAPILTTWLNWFASDAIGVVTVAPLVIGLARTLHDLPEMSELMEGSLALVVLTLVSAIGFGAPTDYWFTILPLTLLFPLLLWPAAHCRPVFAAAATFILALAIVWTITFGIGRLGDPSIRLADRVHAAEAALLAISACALGLAALFAERRRNEAALKDSNDRLQLALDCAELGIWSLDAKNRPLRK